jgi:hypothetical protein
MIKGNEGYGWGVWLIPEDELLSNMLNHQPHITITCNMEKEIAYEYYNTIKSLYGVEHQILFDSHCDIFKHNKYTNDELYNYCSGYMCSSVIWDKFENIYNSKLNSYVGNYGNFSKNPHLTYSYAKRIQDVIYSNNGKIRELKCKLVIADIRDPEPSKWHVIF